MPPPRSREIGLPQHGAREMTLAQVRARERGHHYCLRARSVAWPTSHSTKYGHVYGTVRLPGGVNWGQNAEWVYTLAEECSIVRRTVSSRN